MLSVIGIVIICFVLIISQAIAPPYYGLDRPALDYELPPLPYSFDSLEPYIDEETVRVHYLGHHSKYAENMNIILKQWRKNTPKGKHASRISIIDILCNLTLVPPKFRTAIQNNAGGFVNHDLYWSVLSSNPQGDDRIPHGQLFDDITSKFRSFQEFREVFTDMANKFFGSGYIWLCRNRTNLENPRDLVIVSTVNQDSPLINGLWPILGLDIWEHAYYLKHHNHRAKYVHDWWFLVDWQAVNQLDEWWTGLKLHDEL